MGLFGRARNYLRRVMSSPRNELDRVSRILRFQIQLWRYSFRRLGVTNAFDVAAALSYQTIFALVPALVLAMTIASSIGVLEDSKSELRRVLTAAGFSQITLAPQTQPDAAGEPPILQQRTATDWIIDTVEGVQEKLTLGAVGPIGAIVLIWASITLMLLLERALNRIFEARQARTVGGRLLLYWGALTLAPIAVAAAVFLANAAAGALEGMPALRFVVVVLGWIGNALVGIIVLATVYRIVPNVRTDISACAFGAGVALALWMIAERGFTFYVSRFVATGNLYGALGLLPLFLFWLYLSWLIFLFGGQIAYTWANVSHMEAAELAEKITLGPIEVLAGAVAVARAYAAGEGPLSFQHIVHRLELPGPTVNKIMDQLAAMGVVTCVERQAETSAYVLARPPEKISVPHIMQFLPEDDRLEPPTKADPNVAEAVRRVKDRVRAALGDYTLADVLRDLQT